MGIEVDLRDINLQCPASSALGTFLGALWEFIKFMKVAVGAKVTPDGSGSKSKDFVVPEADDPGSSDDDDFVTKVQGCAHVHASSAYSIPCTECRWIAAYRQGAEINNSGGWTGGRLDSRGAASFTA
jgi:hypothetical protein